VCRLLSIASVARPVRTHCRASFACVARLAACCSRMSRVSRMSITGVAASARDNKLFSRINTHVNNVNSSYHIF
jgi:hypothetical protein